MVSDPSISPMSGTYTSPQTITVSDSTSGATICVRTDGGTPTANTPGTCDSPATGYTSGAQFPLTIPSGGAKVEALGTLAGYANSSVVTNPYSLAGAAATPTFSPVAGTYSSAQTVTISTTSSGAVICWTTTGTPATNGVSGCTNGTLYSGPVTVNTNETLYAVAGGTGYSDSSVSPAAYTINTGPQVYYYIQDSLGTTRVMTDSSGTVCYDADFYPFGGERNYVDNCDQNYKFTGRERDAESNLDNFAARYDSSQVGRFMSPDPNFSSADRDDPQSWNRYAYTVNNPLRYIDPDGECWVASPSGNGQFDWMDRPNEGQTCYTELATQNGDNVDVYGPTNASDKQTFSPNSYGYINAAQIAATDGAYFTFKSGANTYASPQTAVDLYNGAFDYHTDYPTDDKLVITDIGNATGTAVPGHQTHNLGRSVDLRYMDQNGHPIQGESAVLKADDVRMRDMVKIFQENGFNQNYSDDNISLGTQWAPNHLSHIHFGKTLGLAQCEIGPCD
jgi:RHS repeat-associated protein